MGREETEPVSYYIVMSAHCKGDNCRPSGLLAKVLHLDGSPITHCQARKVHQ